MNQRLLAPALGAVLIGSLSVGCDFDSVTAAREQLQRGSNDTFAVVIPLVNDTFFIATFLNENDTVTTSSGLLGMRVQQGDVTFDFANVLQSQQVTTSLAASPPAPGPAAVPGTSRDTMRFDTPDGSNVTSAIVESGFVVRDIDNNTTCGATISLSLLDAAANGVVVFPDVFIAASGNAVDSVNAAGASLTGFADVSTSVNFGACIPGVGSTVDTDITFRPMTLRSVGLDNLNERFAVEEAQELNRTDLQFDELEDAINQSTINDATVDITVINTADLAIELVSFTLGAVRLNASGLLSRDGGGNLIFETDASGNPIKIPVVASGQATLPVPRNGTVTTQVQAAALADRIVHILLDNERVAFVAAGTAAADDGSAGTVAFADLVDVDYAVTVGLDFTIPVGGIEFEVNQASDGLDLTPEQADDLATRVIDAGASARADNFTPFGIEVVAAIAPDSLADNVDVFAQPGAIFLDTIALAAPAVNAAGVPQGSTSDSVGVGISGSEARVLLEDFFTAGIRIRLMPGVGGGGRGALRPNDMITVSAGAVLQVRRGSQ